MTIIPFKDYIIEKYVNLVGPHSLSQKEKYIDTVWKMVNDAYASIGGIHGSGFASKTDMIKIYLFGN